MNVPALDNIWVMFSQGDIRDANSAAYYTGLLHLVGAVKLESPKDPRKTQMESKLLTNLVKTSHLDGPFSFLASPSNKHHQAEVGPC